jgi:hypothetical protein
MYSLNITKFRSNNAVENEINYLYFHFKEFFLTKLKSIGK